MGKTKVVTPQGKMRPAISTEARENQMISLAVDLAEKQLREGTASSQVITHFLKLATARERLEREKLEKENKLLEVKADAIEAGKRSDEIYEEALRAMREYNGQGTVDEDY
jgi:hypothetical protein